MISKTGLHAIKALAALAGLADGAYAGAADVAQSIGAPRNYLGKLLKALANAGLVESQKGKGGGFRLARAPSLIPLLDVLEPIEPIARWSGCFLGGSQCSDGSPCCLHDRWKTVRDVYLQFLSETTIADLLGRIPAASGNPTGH